MRDVKSLEKKLGDIGEEAMTEIFEWEMKHQNLFQTLSLSEREHLLPTVAVWGVKKGK